MVRPYYFRSALKYLIKIRYFCPSYIRLVRQLAKLWGILLLFGAPALSFAQSEKSDTINIGLLIRDQNDLAIRHTARLAIEHAHASPGFEGKIFDLKIKACNGPWGVGSKRAVDLIYEHEVPIIVTALDGRNAHLAEQVSAKSHVVMVSSMASDPSLSRAYVPWFFRMVPDDHAQSKILVEKIYGKDKARKVLILSLDDYDGKISANALVDRVKEENLPVPEIMHWQDDDDLYSNEVDKAWDVIILSGTSPKLNDIAGKINTLPTPAVVYGFHNVFNFMDSYYPGPKNAIKVVRPFSLESDAWKTFETAFYKNYKYHPSPALAFVYDGMMIAIKAIKKIGSDPEVLRSGFKSLTFNGITGRIAFDGMGNRELPLKIDR